MTVVAGYAATNAEATLLVGLRVAPGTGYTVFDGGNNALLTPHSGPVTLQLWAEVSGRNGVHDETVTLVSGSMYSSNSTDGGLLGNLSGVLVAPFNAEGSNVGIPQDLDGDGDLDIGGEGSIAAGKLSFRAASAQPATEIIDANTARILVGSASFDWINGRSTTVMFVPRQGSGGSVASWSEDGVTKNPSSGSFGLIWPYPKVVLKQSHELYWDLNGSAAGTGSVTPGGAWGAGTVWNAAADGAGATGAWVNNMRAHFSAGTDAAGPYAVSVSGTQTARSLHFDRGNATLTGGQINLSEGTIDVASGADAAIAAVLGGNIGVIKTGAGILALRGANIYTGATTIQAGAISVTAANQLGDPSATLVLDGGTLRAGAAIAITRPIQSITAGTIDTAGFNVTSSGGVTGSGGLTKAGSGTLTLQGVNSYKNVTTVAAGTLRATGSLNSGSLVNNAQLTANATTVAFASASTNAENARIDLTNASLRVGTGRKRLTSAGRIQLNNSSVTGDVLLTKTGVIATAGNATFTGNIIGEGRLEVPGGSIARLPRGSGKCVVVSELSLLGTLDIADNRMVLRAAPAGSSDGDRYTRVVDLVTDARNGGGWNGAGITTSMTDAAVSGEFTTIGIAHAIDVDRSHLPAWDGFVSDSADVLIKYTYAGDADLNGKIDCDDYARIDFNVAEGGALKGWSNGDFNYDGSVQSGDYAIINAVLLSQGAPLETYRDYFVGSAVVSSVPEPASAALGAIVLLHAARRRRR